MGIPPEGHDDDGDDCGGEDGTAIVIASEEPEDEDRYKPDMGKNVIYHSFDFTKPKIVDGGGIINLPETDAAGNPVYLVDEFGELLLDWKGEPQLAYENARRVRFITQQKSKAGASKTVLVTLYRQGEEGSGKPADIFMRRMVAPSTGNPYAFGNFVAGRPEPEQRRADRTVAGSRSIRRSPSRCSGGAGRRRTSPTRPAKNPYNDSPGPSRRPQRR